jgi:hypothetical protein
MADETLEFLSKATGLPIEQIKKEQGDPNDPGQQFLKAAVGTATPEPLQRSGYNDPLDSATRAFNLSNVYTDSLESYGKTGIALNPYSDWNEQRAQRQSTFDKWVNGLTKAGITTLGAVTENTLGVLAGLGEMATGGQYYDNFVGKGIDKVNDWAQTNLPNYYTQAEQNQSVLAGMGTANFWADKVANGVGYSLGSIATMWLGTGELGIASKVIGKTASLAGKTAKAVGLASKTGSLLDDAALLGSKQLALYKAGKAIETGAKLERMAAVARFGTATERLAVATQMSLAEASVEARETKNRFIEEQTAKWESENPGQAIPEDVLNGINESANAAGNTAFAINLPILATSNILMFGKMFKGAKIGERVVGDLAEKEAATAAKGAVWAESVGDTKLAKVFSKSQRMFGKPLGNMATEGFQEGSQFAASEFSRDYYGDKFSDGAGDMSKSISESLSATFGTKEGLENILIGAIVGGGTGAVSRIAGADSKLAKQQTANSAKVLQYLNSGGMTRVLENMESNDYNRKQVNIMEASNKIIEDPNASSVQKLKAQQEANRARIQLIRSEARRYDKIGATDYMLAQLEDAALMPEEEFKKAHGYALNKTLQEQTGKTQGELIQDVKDTIELSMKRARQVEDILAKYQPKYTLLPKLMESLQSDETKANKALQQHVRGMYANMLHAGLMDIDVIDSQIDEMYDELIKSSPSLNELSKEEFAYKVKVGDVTVSEDGNLKFSTLATSAREKALADKLNEIFKAKNTLNPADAESFKDNVFALEGLMRDRERITTAFDNIRRNPEEMDLYVQAQYVKKQAEEQRINAEMAAQVVQNAETADELRENMPDDAPEEVLAEAERRIEELEREERAQQISFENLSDGQLDALNEDELPPIAAAALAKEKDIREKRRLAQNTRLSLESDLGQLQRRTDFIPTASYEEVRQELSDAEEAAFFNISVSTGGFIFTINNRTYLNLNDSPLEALIYDENGNRVGLKLTDAATGNEVTWMLNEGNETDIAIADTVTYSILLQASSIRDVAEQARLSTAEAKEIAKIRGEAVTETVVEQHRAELEAAREDLTGKAKKFEITESLEDPEAVAESENQFETFVSTTNIGQTVGLTDGQVRAQIEVIKEDLGEIDETIEALRQFAMELAAAANTEFTEADFNKDGQVKALKAIRKSHKALLTKKIKELAKRKKVVAQEGVGENELKIETEQEIEQTPTDDEGDEIIRGEELKISRLENEIAEMTAVAKELQKIADGVYPGQNVESAKKELRNIKSKISRRAENIRVAKQLIDRINEERKSEKLRQDSDTAEGIDTATEGQESEGTNIDPREGSTAEGLDGTTTDEELENIRRNREALNQIDDQTSRLGDNPNESKDPLENQVKPIVVSEGDMDAPLVKGEIASSPDFKTQNVDDNGNPRTNMIQQKVGGDVIQLFPEMLTDNTVIATGTQVIFEVDETTDWWNSDDPSTSNNKKDLTEDRYWEQVPIYVTVQLANGQTVRVGMLAASGASRKDIYTLYKKGLTPVSTINSKLFDTTNIANARTESGEVFFYPSNGITKGAPRIAFVKTVDGIPTWTYAGEPAPFTADNNTPGQVGIIVENPNGGMSLVIASTKNMTESGRTKAIDHIIKDEPEPQLFGEIVGLNKSPVEIESEDAAIEIQDDAELKEPDSEFFKRFMHQATLVDGTVLFTFYSKSANKLVRLNAEELKKALLNQQFKFSFSDVAVNEKGFKELVTVKAEADVYQSIAPNLRQEFFDIIMTKKFQVSERSLYNTGQYVSALTGTTYDSYFDYLNSATEFEGEQRTEGKGANVILATDSPGNVYKSPFYDVGLQFAGLSALEGGVETQIDSEAEEVERAAKPAEAAPAFPTSTDAKADIERRRQEELKNYDDDGGMYDDDYGKKTRKINDKYDAELAALEQPATTTPVVENVVTVYHHTSVAPQDFDFGNFQRGKDQISQFGDGLNASSTTTPFLVQRYGQPIAGEINESEFIVIDANKSEKEIYEELKAKGYKFSNPATGSYISDNPDAEYDDAEKANQSPAIINLFNDFQKSNPEVKGVKVLNHIIGNQKVDPFYVIYNAKSFYGPGSLSKTKAQPAVTPPTVVPAAPAPVAQTLTDAPVDALPADLFGAVQSVPQKPVSSTIELPPALAKYAVSPEKAAELNSMNPTGAPMQDLGDEIERMCNPNI